MQLSELLKSAEVEKVRVTGDAELSSLVADSRRACAGACFVAVRGPDVDGHAFIASAIAAGASAVICEDDSAVPPHVARAVLPQTRTVLGPLAQAFHGHPARKLTNIGVTGTKGKSTVTYLIRGILEHAGHKPALLGTISYETGLRSIEANNTTPGAVELAEMSAEMVRAGKTHLVMEVSSHALHQGRTAGIGFAAGAFTNLTGEHMDYHKTMEEYLLAKRLLIDGLSPSATAIVNSDDPASDRMVGATGARVMRFGMDGPADLSAEIRHSDVHGTQFDMLWQGKRTPVATPLIGRHNVSNCLAAAGACLAVGVDMQTIAAALATVANVPGRLQRVDVPAPFQVFVDYAHTDDAMEKALTAVRPLTKGQLAVVFGCGGDRDKTKRPRMAAVAQRLADRVYITSDNPRTEDPEAIIRDILAGLSPSEQAEVHVQADRKAAIEHAIAQAQEGDLVLLAGKGHENYQIIGKTKSHFDDAEVAAGAMLLREGFCSMAISAMCSTGVSPVASSPAGVGVLSMSEEKTDTGKMPVLRTDTAETAVIHTGKMPVPRLEECL